jgi:hypothetical protein
MKVSFLGLALINGWYIPWFILDKRMVHSLGRRVERNMRLMDVTVVGVVNFRVHRG